MIFEELVLTDVGPFAGEHRVPLTPRSNDQPVVLFGGLNGSGKTTVIESLLLALYGGLTPGTARRASSYDKYLRQLINRGADPARGAIVELAFRAIHDGAWHTFRIQRRWWTAADRTRETIEVTRDGALDIVLTEAWPDHVETLAPRGVANLFFFDGEQIEAFADLDVARELVRTAIGGLLGLDLVDRLQDDLTVLERRKRAEAVAGDKEEQFVQSKLASLEAARRQEADARHAMEAADRELTLAQRQLELATARLTKEGGDRYRARDQLLTRRQDTTAHLKQRQAALVEALGGLGPLLLVEPLLDETIAQALAERRQADNQVVAELLAERDARIQDILRQQRAAAKIQQAVTDFLTEDLAHRKTGDGIPLILGTHDRTLALAQQLVAADLDEERHLLAALLDDLATAQSAADDADRAVAAIPDADSVDQAMAHHQDAQYAAAQAHTRLDAARQAFHEATTQRHALERAVERELLEANAAIIQSEEARRLIEHAARARTTLARLRAAATQRHTQRIEALILDSLQTLLRKEKLVREVRIDPETCEVELFTHDGHPLKPRTLSAGERQLLAVSLLAGLARASGRMLPVVIDTPLGRLDLDHRHRLIERYIPHASHQVIVLSTDTEITAEALGYLGTSISHMIKLEYDHAARTSTVNPGYFPSQRAAADDMQTVSSPS